MPIKRRLRRCERIYVEPGMIREGLSKKTTLKLKTENLLTKKEQIIPKTGEEHPRQRKQQALK